MLRSGAERAVHQNPANRGRLAGNVRNMRVFKSTGFGVGLPLSEFGRDSMSKFSIKLLALAVCSMALVAVPLLTSAYAAGGDNPAPPATDTSKKKKTDKSSSIDSPKFLDGYRTAYTTIYDRHDYASRDRAAEGARPGRPRRRRQPDRLLLSQARRLQGFADLVRARAEGRPEPCADLAVLRPLAARTGQPRSGRISPATGSPSSPAPTARNIARWPRRSKSRPAPASSTEFGR